MDAWPSWDVGATCFVPLRVFSWQELKKEKNSSWFLVSSMFGVWGYFIRENIL
jgi:hypothetical protein